MIHSSLSLCLSQDTLQIIDQQLLPFEEKWITVESPEHMIEIIKALKVRGAPLIGVAAGLSLALWALKEKPTKDSFLKMSQMLRESRPTAVNLMNALDELNSLVSHTNDFYQAVYDKALKITKDDEQLCLDMGQEAAKLINDGERVLTHCNTGGLATAGIGTALGAIQCAWEDKKQIHVYVDETRPLLQGGRLTVWELAQLKVPHTLICDNMAGFLMAQGKVDKIFVGTDRIAMNGDFANKIGTYSLAVLANYHKVPMYVVAPSTTIDKDCPTGKEIPIEERKAFEVKGVEGSFGKTQWALDTDVYNPAFDVTPVDLISGIIVDDQTFTSSELKAGALSESIHQYGSS